MNTIHKFCVGVTRTFSVLLEKNAKVLVVGQQRGQICLWVLLDPAAPHEAKAERKFYVFGTGHDVPKELEHVGTAFIEEYVWHVFQEPVTEH